MNAKIKKAVAARLAKRDAEKQRILKREAYEERERVRKYKMKLKERRPELRRQKGQIITEAEVRCSRCNGLCRLELKLTP